jgi:hypothetical protein
MKAPLVASPFETPRKARLLRVRFGTVVGSKT